MKKLLAKFLHWCLRQLGYTEIYSRRREITIYVTANADDALKELEKLINDTKKLINLQKKIKL